MLNALVTSIYNLLSMLCGYLYISKFLRWKMKNGFFIFAGVISLVQFVIMAVFDRLPVNESTIGTENALFIGIIFAEIVGEVIFLEGKRWKRIITVIFSQIIISELFGIFEFIVGYYIGDGINVQSTMSYLIPTLVAALILFASLPGFKTKSRLELVPQAIIFVCALLSEIYTSVFGVIIVPSQKVMNVSVNIQAQMYSGLDEAIQTMAGTVNLLISFTSVVAIFLAMLITNFVVTHKFYKRNAEINESLLQAQTKYYESIEANTKNMSKLRHDYKNHLTVMSLLLEGGEVDKAKEYINEISEGLSAATPLVHTGNTIADAIISDKIKKATDLGIRINIDGAFSYKDMKPIDICSILGNILDNAIEAVGGVSVSSTDITLTLSKTDCFFVISETNLSSKPLKLDGDKVVTSKLDKVLHGLGIGNIKESAAKYGGDVDISCEPSDSHDGEFVFAINIMIPFAM